MAASVIRGYCWNSCEVGLAHERLYGIDFVSEIETNLESMDSETICALCCRKM